MQTVRAIFPLELFESKKEDLVIREVDSPSQFHHLVRVLRIKSGWQLELLDDSSSRKIKTVVQECSSSSIVLRVTSKSNLEPINPLTLFLALPEFNVLERVVEKCSELQVSEIKIFIPQHTQHKDALNRLNKKIQRLEKIRDAGRIQSGSPALNISIYSGLQEAVSTLAGKGAGQDLRLVASLQAGAGNLQEFLHKNYPLERHIENTDILLVVGPEGDLSVEEYTLCNETGFLPVSLGQSVLRVETAATVFAFTVFSHFNRQ